MRGSRLPALMECLEKISKADKRKASWAEIKKIAKKSENDPRRFCPNCGKRLESSGAYIPSGGSDF